MSKGVDSSASWSRSLTLADILLVRLESRPYTGMSAPGVRWSPTEEAAAELCADSSRVHSPGLCGISTALLQLERSSMANTNSSAEMHTAGSSDRTPANYDKAFNLAIPKPSLEHSFRLCCDLEAVRSLGEGVHGDGGQQVPASVSE